MTCLFPDALLIQFARAPEIGKVKTRMQPQLSEQQSLTLHRRLVGYTYAMIESARLAPLEVWATGNDEARFFETLKPPPVLRQQQGADLGARMYEALADGLQRYQAVVLVGSDCPFLTGALLRETIEMLLSGVDCVLGPATDGGYVLIGLRRSDRSLFSGVTWSTSCVLAQTRRRLKDLGWRWSELEPLPDIDTAADLNLITNLEIL